MVKKKANCSKIMWGAAVAVIKQNSIGMLL